MHELTIARCIVEHCAKRAVGGRVLCVRLEIGRLSCVTAESLLFCFDVCAKDTVVQGAVLEIIPVQGRARCLTCGEEIEIGSFAESCTCGGTALRVIAGEELRLREMEVA
jgi:hydrogenase nickel incorporation protein HypA/HybF